MYITSFNFQNNFNDEIKGLPKTLPGLRGTLQNPLVRMIDNLVGLAFTEIRIKDASQDLKPKVIKKENVNDQSEFTIDLETHNKPNRSVSVAFSQGPRETMEDTHIIDEIILKDGKIIPLFAVMDGHGGTEVANYLQSKLKEYIKTSAEKIIASPGTSPKKIIKIQFELLNKEMKEKGLGKKTGSTAVISFVIENQLYVANVGDSRAVLSHNGFSMALNDDAKPGDPTFDKKVKELGGTIKTFMVNTSKGKKSICRLEASIGLLAVTRAFGDFAFPGVCASPKVETFNLHDLNNNPHTNFLILACDGIWDVLSNQEAVDIVKNELKEGGSPETAAVKLISIAYEKNSRDNCTAMVIPFKK